MRLFYDAFGLCKLIICQCVHFYPPLSHSSLMIIRHKHNQHPHFYIDLYQILSHLSIMKIKTILKTVFITALSFFYFGKHWSNNYDYQQYIFFNSYPNTPSVSLSPNLNKSYDLTSLPLAAPPPPS